MMKMKSIIIKFILINIFLIVSGCKDSSEDKSIIVKFIGYEESDMAYYCFKGTRADTNTYYFSVIPNKYDLVDENGEVNQKYINRFFEIEWDSVVPKTNGEYDYPYNEIKTIEEYRPGPHEASDYGIRIDTGIKCPNCGSKAGSHPHKTIPSMKICNSCGIGY